MRKTILILIFLSLNLLGEQNEMQTAREYFYKATEKEAYIDRSIDLFKKIAKENNSEESLCNMYIGSLTALRATYTYWPNKKLQYANKGIEIMEKSLNNDSENIESLFIYGSTCYYLPFFFGKSEAAENALLKIIDLAEKDYQAVDQKLLKNALEFIINKINPDKVRLRKAKSILKKINL